jgi:hypothetical protein
MVQTLNAFLEPLALLNSAPNHGYSFRVERLPDARTFEDAWRLRFAAPGAATAAPRTVPIAGTMSEALSAIARRWFFEQSHSPPVAAEAARAVVDAFVARLVGLCGSGTVLRVDGDPAVWGECATEDLVVIAPTGRWLLHFGVTD